MKMFLAVLLLAPMAFGGVRVVDRSGVDRGSHAAVKCVSGLDCAAASGNMEIKVSAGAVTATVSQDATPAVSGASNFYSLTGNNYTITDFDGSSIYAGQEIIVKATAAVTLDVTSSGLICGSTDIIAAANDMFKFVYDGTDWRCVSHIDASEDNN